MLRRASASEQKDFGTALDLSERSPCVRLGLLDQSPQHDGTDLPGLPGTIQLRLRRAHALLYHCTLITRFRCPPERVRRVEEELGFCQSDYVAGVRVGQKKALTDRVDDGEESRVRFHPHPEFL